MSALTRRSFLQRLGAVVAAGVVVRELPLPAPPPPPLMFVDKELGISIRFIREWDLQKVSRLDVLYGFPTVIEPLAVRVEGA